MSQWSETDFSMIGEVLSMDISPLRREAPDPKRLKFEGERKGGVVQGSADHASTSDKRVGGFAMPHSVVDTELGVASRSQSAGSGIPEAVVRGKVVEIHSGTLPAGNLSLPFNKLDILGGLHVTVPSSPEENNSLKELLKIGVTEKPAVEASSSSSSAAAASVYSPVVRENWKLRDQVNMLLAKLEKNEAARVRGQLLEAEKVMQYQAGQAQTWQ